MKRLVSDPLGVQQGLENNVDGSLARRLIDSLEQWFVEDNPVPDLADRPCSIARTRDNENKTIITFIGEGDTDN